MIHDPVRILCFGDSNTYGFDPRSPLEDRYPASERWPEILAAATGWDIVNMGLNGRTIPFRRNETELALSLIRRELPADAIVIMLGTNDAFLAGGADAERIAARMDFFLFLLSREFPTLPVLLVSPPCTELPFAQLRNVFPALSLLYRRLAEKHGVLFADAASWPLPLSADGVHFTPEAHRCFALRAETCLHDLLSNLHTKDSASVT